MGLETVRVANKSENVFIFLEGTHILQKYISLRDMVNYFSDYKKLRLELISLCYGIGPKQASHFLKNIGFTDRIAVIDTHILNYLKLDNINIPNKYSITSIKNYEYIENLFLSNVCKKFNYPASIVDQSIWLIMRNI